MTWRMSWRWATRRSLCGLIVRRGGRFLLTFVISDLCFFARWLFPLAFVVWVIFYFLSIHHNWMDFIFSIPGPYVSLGAWLQVLVMQWNWTIYSEFHFRTDGRTSICTESTQSFWDTTTRLKSRLANPAWLWDFLRYRIEKGLRAVCSPPRSGFVTWLGFLKLLPKITVMRPLSSSIWNWR